MLTEQKQKLNFIVADDHPLYMQGLLSTIKRYPGENLISSATNGMEVLKLLENKLADLILMDISMPVMDGIECTKEITKKYPAIKVIALTMHYDEQSINAMFEAGAKGYLLKTANGKEIHEALQKVLKGEFYYSKQISDTLLQKLSSGELKTPTLHQNEITQRETDVLIEICNELTSQQIAEKLFISTKTVIFHRNNLLAKTGAKNVAGLVVYAIEKGVFKIKK